MIEFHTFAVQVRKEQSIFLLIVLGSQLTNDFVTILGMQSTGSASNKPDPCKEVCDINVKIADLGNACWTVSIPF